jgi:Ca2+/Na+ antiporter
MFNTMCIIGGSALIAGKPVPLQWRSIVRDCGVYLASLVALLLMLLDGRIEGWESIVMLGMYVFYIFLCAIWGKLVKAICPVRAKEDDPETLLADAARENYEISRLARQTASSKFKGAANQMIAIQRLQAHTDLAKSTTNLLKKEGTADITTPVAQDTAARRTARQKTMTMDANALQSIAEAANDPEHGADEHGEGGHHEHPGLCDIPKEPGARLAWAVSFPLMFIFTMTVPNCGKYPKVYPLTFFACIVWLGVLVEAMVEHASEFGALLGFSPGILGLTLLAAGTSFPDLVASLIVAKQGSIDMAVSNAFGSNNFDILLCLGLPWMLSIYAVTGRAEVIDTSGIVVALFSLIITTLMWFGYMSATKWVLTPGVGLTMLTTYATWLLCQLILDMFAPQAHE